ncbi:MAG: M56 family metallopeptidase [Alistipes indistinctus]
MWSTLPYLVKVQICFALLWIVYRFFLQRDGRFARSRAYLLLSVPVSFLIPLLSIPVLPALTACARSGCSGRRGRRSPVRAQPVSAAEDASLFAEAAPAALSASPAPSPASGAASAMTVASPGAQASAFFREAAASAFAALVPAGWSGLMYAWLLWCGIAGSLLLLLYYLGHTLRWVRLMREGQRFPDAPMTCVSSTARLCRALFAVQLHFHQPPGFGRNEFRELMAHELCHIRLRHSWDRLLAVVVTLFCWWNPFVWLWHRSLCEVHEYQADDAVLQCGFDAEQYIMLMVSSVAGARTTLASGFSYSLVRKRLQMLSRRASRRAGLRMLLVVPALAVLLALFSFTERPVAAGSPEQVPAELSDQLLSAFGYSADAVPAAVQAQTAAEEGPILFSRDDTVPSDDAEPTAAVQPGAAFADASGVSGYGAPVSRESLPYSASRQRAMMS